MKKIINKLVLTFELIIRFVFSMLTFVFSVINRILKRPNILIFTDSRGFEVTKIWNRKNPFSSYIGQLIFKYNCTVKVCPEKFTSILDFLAFYESVHHKEFDKVILHCGIVDFAPRPESSFDLMYESKIEKIKKYSLDQYINKESRNFGSLYQQEGTLSFLNQDSMLNVLVPLLKKIPNLVYIGINPVLNDWDGNYWRKRPVNINEQLLLDKILITEIDEVVDLSSLTKEEIMILTSDNVHYTGEGFSYIHKKLEPLLPKY